MVININGPEGNAFSLMAMARRWAKQLDMDGESILEDMQSSDYVHLVNVFKREFGHLCEIIGEPEGDGE